MNEMRNFTIEYKLVGRAEWRDGITLGADETGAIANFLSDYSPSMGTIREIRVPQIEQNALDWFGVKFHDWKRSRRNIVDTRFDVPF